METAIIDVTDVRIHPQYKALGLELPYPSPTDVSEMRQYGPIASICVVPGNGDVPYYIISGIRTWRAAGLCQIMQLSALIRTDLTEADISDYLTHAEQQNIIQKARAFDETLRQDKTMTRSALLKQEGISKPHLSSILKLLTLPIEIQHLLETHQLSFGHGKALCRLKSHYRAQQQAAKYIIAEGLSVRDTERLCQLISVQKLPFDRAITQLRKSKPRFTTVKSSSELAPMVQTEPATAEAQSVETVMPVGTASNLIATDYNSDPDTQILEEDLSSRLGNTVRFHQIAGSKGVMVVHYSNFDELDGILSHIA